MHDNESVQIVLSFIIFVSNIGLRSGHFFDDW